MKFWVQAGEKIERQKAGLRGGKEKFFFLLSDSSQPLWLAAGRSRSLDTPWSYEMCVWRVSVYLKGGKKRLKTNQKKHTTNRERDKPSFQPVKHLKWETHQKWKLYKKKIIHFHSAWKNGLCMYVCVRQAHTCPSAPCKLWNGRELVWVETTTVFQHVVSSISLYCHYKPVLSCCTTRLLHLLLGQHKSKMIKTQNH